VRLELDELGRVYELVPDFVPLEVLGLVVVDVDLDVGRVVVVVAERVVLGAV
jgi:hypothetical protein